MMKRIIPVLLLLLVLNLKPVEILAQQTPPDNPIVTPVQGKLAFWSTEGLTILNTFDGTWKILPSTGAYPMWDLTGTYLPTIQKDPDTTGFINVDTLETQTVIASDNPQNIGENERRDIIGWSGDGQTIMYLIRTWHSQVITSGSISSRLEIANLTTGTAEIVLETLPFMMMDTLFPVPEDSQDVILDSIYAARWNPIYTDWLLIQPIGSGKRASTGEDIGVYEAGLYNYVTGQYISLTTLFPQTVVSFTDWSADGRKIALNTMNDISLIEFSVQDGEPVLNLLADGVNSHGQAVLEWLGAGDLLMTGTTLPYRTSFIAQIIDGRWYSREFIALASLTPQYGGGNRDFYLTVSDEERNQLSCMLFDEVFSTQLKVGQQGRVGFTRRTPSHLRAEPALHAPLITEMAQDIIFEVIGGAYCVDDYRWWQVRLEDGTVGWAAEGHPPDYWLRPLDEN